jgi:hypothetical protein
VVPQVREVVVVDEALSRAEPGVGQAGMGAIDGLLGQQAGPDHSPEPLPHTVFPLSYVDRAVIRGELKGFPEADKWLRGVDERGEPWIFGISPEEAPDFLAERGFHLMEDLSTKQAGARYFEPLGRHDRGSGLYRVVTATVDRSSGHEAALLDTTSPP